MSKRIAWLAAAGLSVTSAAMRIWSYREANKPMFLRGENEEQEQGRPPVDGDYWAIRVGYGGDPQQSPIRTALAARTRRNRIARIASGVPGRHEGLPQARRLAARARSERVHAARARSRSPAKASATATTPAARTSSSAIPTIRRSPTSARTAAASGRPRTAARASTTWTVKTDFPEIASMAIGDITIDPSNHNVLYAGTGDLRYGSFSFGSAGVLKSTDKGETWDVLGEDVFNPFYGPSAERLSAVPGDRQGRRRSEQLEQRGRRHQDRRVFLLRRRHELDRPVLHEHVHDGARHQRQDMTGLLAVDNGGTTTVVCGGRHARLRPRRCSRISPRTARTASIARRCRRAAVRPSPTGRCSTAACPPAPATARRTRRCGRIEIAAAPSDRQTLYAMVVRREQQHEASVGVYKTTDGGDHLDAAGRRELLGCGGAARRCGTTPASPSRRPIRTCCSSSTVDLFRSTNGGTTFTNLTNAYSGGPVHPDNHARAFVGGDPDQDAQRQRRRRLLRRQRSTAIGAARPGSR